MQSIEIRSTDWQLGSFLLYRILLEEQHIPRHGYYNIIHNFVSADSFRKKEKIL